jgi:hypothetical protein
MIKFLRSIPLILNPGKHKKFCASMRRSTVRACFLSGLDFLGVLCVEFLGTECQFKSVNTEDAKKSENTDKGALAIG